MKNIKRYSRDILQKVSKKKSTLNALFSKTTETRFKEKNLKIIQGKLYF